MTDEQMRIAIAEACGWKVPNGCTNYRVRPEGSRVFFNPLTDDDPLPDYLNDLNACSEFEAMLNSVERFTYLVELNKLCGDEPSAVWATARQRAEAFLKTKGILP